MMSFKDSKSYNNTQDGKCNSGGNSTGEIACIRKIPSYLYPMAFSKCSFHNSALHFGSYHFGMLCFLLLLIVVLLFYFFQNWKPLPHIHEQQAIYRQMKTGVHQFEVLIICVVVHHWLNFEDYSGDVLKNHTLCPTYSLLQFPASFYMFPSSLLSLI